MIRFDTILLYFVIFAAFKKPLTLNLAQVIQGHTFWRKSKASARLRTVNGKFRFILNRFGDIAGYICPEPIA